MGAAGAEPAAVRADGRRHRSAAAPLDAFAAGQGSDVPLLIGSNRDEARLFLVAAGTIDLIDDATLEAAAAPTGCSPTAGGLPGQPPGATPGDLLAAVVTDWFFAVPALRVAEARAAAGTAPTWVYRFDHPDPSANHGFGACHAVEIPFVFDTISREDSHALVGDTPSPAVAKTMHGTWVSFITGGNPGWAPYDTDRRPVALLTDDLTETADPAGDERALWDGIR